MFNSTFKIVYFIEMLIITTVRSMGTAKYRKVGVKVDQKSTIDVVLLALNGIAMLLPLIYVFSFVFDFANFELPDWTGWLGAVFFLLAIYLLWSTHHDLGRNWTPTLGIREEHKLVTGGIYKFIRHPMYTAHLVWAVAQILMLHNWIAGPWFLITSTTQYLLRVDSEEQMMIEQFGDAYKAYMRKTGRFFPKISE